MKTENGSLGTLRRQAEARLRRRRPPDLDQAPANLRTLVHELEVHQVELQVQNEELRQTEQALSEAEAAYRDLYEHAPIAYLTLDGAGALTRANLTASALFGRERDRMIGVRFEALLHPDDRDAGWVMLQEVAAGGTSSTRELRIDQPGAAERWVQVQAAADLTQKPGGRGGFRLTLTDVSERRAAEKALQASETRLRTVLEGTTLAVWETDAEGRMSGDCRLWEAHTGLGASQCRDHDWLAAVHPDEREEAVGLWQQAVRKVCPFDVEVRLRRPDGGWRWTNLRAAPLRREDGTVAGWIGISLDVSDRRRAEQAEAEARRKDEFLAILAHELRNPLAPIRISVDLLQALGGDPVASAEPLRIMDDQVSHLARLIDDLLDVSRISRGKIQLRRERLELAEVIRAALDMSESRLEQDDRQFRVEVPSEPLPVDGDRVRLVQVFANLLNNAAKFTDAGGHIELGVTRAGDRVEIRVQDDGRGIPPEQLDRIFEMFSQAGSDQGAGLGIGLSLVRGLVDMHGGTVSAESQGPGCGAIFTVSLPLFPGAPVKSTADKATELGVPTGQCRVLVVDDNPDIVRGLQMLLTTLGAGVRVAHDGAEALRIFDDWPPTHVLMDIGMPGMDGYEAARRLRTDHADQAFRLIAVTGWGQEEDRQRALEAGFDEHLVKPVRLERLKEVLSA